MRSSMLSPKSRSTHMLLMMCSQPPCRNMALKILTQVEEGSLQNCVGMNPQVYTNALSPGPCNWISYRKTTTLTMTSRILINGNRRERTVSYKGIIIYKRYVTPPKGSGCSAVPSRRGESRSYNQRSLASLRMTFQVNLELFLSRFHTFRGADFF